MPPSPSRGWRSDLGSANDEFMRCVSPVALEVSVYTTAGGMIRYVTSVGWCFIALCASIALARIDHRVLCRSVGQT